MGYYTGLRFKGIVKKEFRENFEGIALSGEWAESNDNMLKQFGTIDRASFIPCGALAYMPSSWEKAPYNEYGDGIPSDGFERSYNKESGRWTFQCSLKNYSMTIEHFLKMVPYFIESVEWIEVRPEDHKSIFYSLIDGKIQLVDKEGDEEE